MELDDLFFDQIGTTVKRYRRGPHWRQDGKLFFVTWRQADSIPLEQREEILRERENWLRSHGDRPFELLPEGTRRAYERLHSKRMQEFLDAGYGSCVLKRPEACDIVVNALRYFDGKHYRLGTFAIAGNHVHVLAALFPGIELSAVQHSWKSFTSNAINEALGLHGRLWRTESYDRIVRDEDELERIEDYILGHARFGHHVEDNPFDFVDRPTNFNEAKGA